MTKPKQRKGGDEELPLDYCPRCHERVTLRTITKDGITERTCAQCNTTIGRTR